MLVILFGPPGAGKTHIGKILKHHFNFFFLDGDNVLSQSEIECVRNKTPFSDEQRRSITNNLINRIDLFIKLFDQNNIVISQALFTKRARSNLKMHFNNARFVFIDTPKERCFQQANDRKNGIDGSVVDKFFKNFERPDEEEIAAGTLIFKNDDCSEEEIINFFKENLHITPTDYNISKINLIDLSLENHIENDSHRFNIRNDFTYEIASHKIKFSVTTLKYITQEFVSNEILYIHQKMIDYSILFDNQSSACLISRNGAIIVFNEDKKDDLFKKIIKQIGKDLNKISIYKPIQFLEWRNNENVINEYYRPFYPINSHEIIQRFIMIKSINGNTHFLKKTSHIPAILFEHSTENQNKEKILYFEGSGFTRHLNELAENNALNLATKTGLDVFLVYPRLAPEYPLHHALMDAFSGYEYLVDVLKCNNFFIAGYSSGGTLALMLISLLLKTKSVKPQGFFIVSPVTDFTFSSLPNEICKDRYLSLDLISKLFHSARSPYIKKLNLDGLSEFNNVPTGYVFKFNNDAIHSHTLLLIKALEHNQKITVINLNELDHCAWWDNALPLLLILHNIRTKEASLAQIKIKAKFDDQDVTFIPSYIKSKEDIKTISILWRNIYKAYSIPTIVFSSLDNSILKTLIQLIFYQLNPFEIETTKEKNISTELENQAKHLSILLNQNQELNYQVLLFKLGQELTKHNFNQAFYLCQDLLEKWPSNLIVYLISETIYFYSNDSKAYLDTLKKIETNYFDLEKKILKNNLSEMDFYLTYLGGAYIAHDQLDIGLMLCGQALKLNPLNLKAIQSISVAYYRKGEYLVASNILKLHKLQLEIYQNEVTQHCFFILALSLVNLSLFDEAYAVYEKYLCNDSLSHINHHLNKVVFLWRLDLVSNLPNELKAKVNKEFNKIFYSGSFNIIKEKTPAFPFLSLINLYVCLRNKEKREGETILTLLTNGPESIKGNFITAIELAHSIINYFNDDLKSALDKLEINSYRACFGGYPEQLDILKLFARKIRLMLSQQPLENISDFENSGSFWQTLPRDQIFMTPKMTIKEYKFRP